MQSSKIPMKIWGRKDAFNVQKVMWLVHELQLTHEHIPVGGRYGGLDTEEFLAMNPHGRIPVIQDGDTIVYESHSILRYLAACYGKNSFWDENPHERAKIEPWMDWQQTSLQPDFLNGVFLGYYRTPPEQRDWPAINASLQRCYNHFQLLNSQLHNKPFLCGNSLSLADIAVGTTLYRYFELDIERPNTPHVKAWYNRLRQRPAYSMNVMIPFDSMRGQ